MAKAKKIEISMTEKQWDLVTSVLDFFCVFSDFSEHGDNPCEEEFNNCVQSMKEFAKDKKLEKKIFKIMEEIENTIEVEGIIEYYQDNPYAHHE
jgi:sulfur relay (sulfurtransferase) DsrC/TusE family protein